MRNDILEHVRSELKKHSNPQTKISGQRFFKEEIKLHGVKSTDVHKISKTHNKAIQGLDKTEVFELCEELFKSGYLEESVIACHWSYFVRKKYEPDDICLFEKWIKEYVGNWATCDTLCNHTVGDLVKMFPAKTSALKSWATSKNRWLKRASAVSLIIPARKGMFVDDILEIAEILLEDQDDMVQKGYGWMLKALSEPYQDKVYNFVIKHKKTMPRTALRYAIEKMPHELKTKAMKRVDPH